MITESRANFDRGPVHSTCEEMGEAAVLADLERAGLKFSSSEQKWLAWEWVYAQRLDRDEAQSRSIRDTARWTLLVAIFTFFVALFTAFLAWDTHNTASLPSHAQQGTSRDAPKAARL
ncbi:MAG: hypothetical protein AB2765_20355 [Candidatus Thiodiazotropha endolucinida]